MPVYADKNWTVSFGLGSIYTPAFSGSKDYVLSAVPDLRIKYKESFFASIPEGIGYNLVTRSKSENGLKFGPLVKIKFSRGEDNDNPFSIIGKSDALKGMGEIGTAYEPGIFIDYKFNVLQCRFELRRGFGGHDGLVSNIRLNYAKNFGPLIFGIGPRLTWADNKYNQTYYGINHLQSLKTGLEEYSPRSGIVSYGIGTFMVMPITKKIVTNGFIGYEKMGEPATHSPLIRERGSGNQFSAGIGFVYNFNF
jgi:outer membrane scaffolding protein for murein synthesis (MipA/OmpV family)